jgi:hypothetical protein
VVWRRLVIEDAHLNYEETDLLASLAVGRAGPRPATTTHLPHLQMDQFPTEKIFTQFLESCKNLDHLHVQESRIATPFTTALRLDDRVACGPPEAFLDDHEFCHIHPLPHGTIHLTLPIQIQKAASDAGWVERHLMSSAAFVPKTFVIVYAPRNSEELAIILKIVNASAHFAMGKFRRV